MIAPASVPPVYCPEHEVADCVKMVVVAWRATSAGVAGRNWDASVAPGAMARLVPSDRKLLQSKSGVVLKKQLP